MKNPKLKHLGYSLTALFLFLVVLSNWPASQANSPQKINQNIPAEIKINDTVTITKNADSEILADENLFLVTRVVDGDTIKLSDGRAVRYLGIDTPESVDPKKPVQCLAEAASAKNKELVLGQKINLVFDQEKIDRYGRTLAYVFLDEKFINLELVEVGLARAYPYAPNFLHKKNFAEAQKRAQQNQLGLWSGICQKYIPPKTSATTANIPPDKNCPIKGNLSSSGEKIYHLPEQKYYNNTRIDSNAGEKWFCSETEAVGAGFRKSQI